MDTEITLYVANGGQKSFQTKNNYIHFLTNSLLQDIYKYKKATEDYKAFKFIKIFSSNSSILPTEPHSNSL